MNDQEENRIEKESSDLRSEIGRLWRALKVESDSSTKHILKIYERIKLIDDYIGKVDLRSKEDAEILAHHISDLQDIVSPIEDKIFPHAKETRKQVKAIVGPKRLGDGKQLDKKNAD